MRIGDLCYWRVSETLSGLNNENRRFMLLASERDTIRSE